MTRILIKNFGPIKNDRNTWVEVDSLTLIIGAQGAGKSSIAKLISIFSWIEKACYRGDYDQAYFGRKNRFNQFLNYHRLRSYLSDKSEITYEGEAYHIKYKNARLTIKEAKGKDSYHLPQVMYVPSERNFISYVDKASQLKVSSEALQDFLSEYDNALQVLKGATVDLPINGIRFEYDRLNKTPKIKGTDYRIKLSEASSGIQSVTPLCVVSSYLANQVQLKSEERQIEMSKEQLDRVRADLNTILATDMTPEQRRVAISVVMKRFNMSALINIIEEPEQNLYPTSQKNVLEQLLSCNHSTPHNKMVMTTHSPYIINYLTLFVKGYALEQRISMTSGSDELLERLYQLTPKDSLIDGKRVRVYQLDDQVQGELAELSAYEGLPSDENYLNELIEQGNEWFSDLLDIEEEICQ